MNRRLKNKITPYLLISPAILLTFLVVGYPIFYNIYIGFFSWKLSSPTHKFIGLANYNWIFKHDFVKIVLNTVTWTACSVIFAFLIGLALACYVDGRKKTEGIYRSFLLLPWIIPSIIVVFIWRWMLQSDLGVLNHILIGIGMIKEPVNWLANEKVVMGTVIMVNVWKAFSMWFIMLLAGLKSLPTETLEAARIDGANAIAVFRFVKLPHLSPVILTTGILSIIWSLNYVELIYAMTGGGPDNATMTMTVQSYLWGFEIYDFGRSSAMSTLALLVIVIMIVPYVKLMFRQLDEGGER